MPKDEMYRWIDRCIYTYSYIYIYIYIYICCGVLDQFLLPFWKLGPGPIFILDAFLSQTAGVFSFSMAKTLTIWKLGSGPKWPFLDPNLTFTLVQNPNFKNGLYQHLLFKFFSETTIQIVCRRNALEKKAKHANQKNTNFSHIFEKNGLKNMMLQPPTWQTGLLLLSKNAFFNLQISKIPQT